ncbi:M24 family metallopeptidase [Natrarchaeobaculum aegyptiacum]|uniref:Peptidase M24 domain-containing protein n=1 Tax=Natrarchaeobaculum aegyptiacum TaxID=745377 RepID=A0A2Z2HSI3_9EURY|nr:M24 family metallopeptidase [Natrarchaeobaculum aegyptiacum]ARS90102.1 hypothetical protein B1756_10425 [Natrarchaeobaculum aegyptiacum]
MVREVRAYLESTLEAELDARAATGVVHAGPARDPAIRYWLEASDEAAGAARVSYVDERRRLAVAYTAASDSTIVHSDADSSHPAEKLASDLADRGLDGTVLTPAAIPHDAALYLERAGFGLASTDVLERARATKIPGERERIAAAQSIAGDGIERAAAVLAGTTVRDDGWLEHDGVPLTPDRLRIAADEAIVAAGGLPSGNTRVDPGVTGADDGALRAGDPIVVTVAPRTRDGYHGGLVRTFVVAGEGGPERRAHVGVTHAFRSSEAMLTADSHSVTAVEADLEAEVRAFGVAGEENVETDVAGVGLEPREAPLAGGDEVGPGCVVRLEAAGCVDGAWVRVADVLSVEDDGVEWLPAPSRSLEPTALLE